MVFFFNIKNENNLLLLITRRLVVLCFHFHHRGGGGVKFIGLGVVLRISLWDFISRFSEKFYVNLLLRLFCWFIIRPSSSKLGQKSKAHPDKNLHNVHFQSKSEAVLF